MAGLDVATVVLIFVVLTAVAVHVAHRAELIKWRSRYLSASKALQTQEDLLTYGKAEKALEAAPVASEATDTWTLRIKVESHGTYARHHFYGVNGHQCFDLGSACTDLHNYDKLKHTAERRLKEMNKNPEMYYV